MSTKNAPGASYVPVNSTTKTAVANYLIDRVGIWVDSADISVLGDSGPRRMRELRENGWAITSRTAPGARTRQFKLSKAPTKAIQSQYRIVPKVSRAAKKA